MVDAVFLFIGKLLIFHFHVLADKKKEETENFSDNFIARKESLA